MSWINTLIDVGILAGQISTVNTLSSLQKQGAEMAQIEAVLNELRNNVFRFREAAEEVLLIEDEERPKRIAAAMQLLEVWYRESGLSPSLFLSLFEKEYAASTSRLLRANAKRLKGKLSLEEQAEVDRIIELALKPRDFQSQYDVQRFFGEHSTLKSLSAQSSTPLASTSSTSSSGNLTGSQSSAVASKPSIDANMITCGRCGEKVSSREIYCPYCSAKLQKK